MSVIINVKTFLHMILGSTEFFTSNFAICIFGNFKFFIKQSGLYTFEWKPKVTLKAAL